MLELIEIDVVARRSDLFAQLVHPRAMIIKRDPQHAREVGSNFHITLVKRANTCTPQPADEEAQLQNDVLTSA